MAEDVLRASEQSFRLMIDGLPGLITSMDAAGVVEFVNQPVSDFFGKTADELRDWAGLVHPDDREHVVAMWRRSIETGLPYETVERLLGVRGYRWFNVRGLPLRDDAGRIVRWYFLLTDLEDLKRAMPREWLTLVGARLLGPTKPAPRPPIEVHNEIVIPAPAERVWELLTDVAGWPSWYRACRWVRVESTDSEARAVSFRWKSHPVELGSTVVAVDRPHRFAFIADSPGIHAERAFTIRPTPDGSGSVVVSHETQVGMLASLGRMYLGPRLRAVNQVMFEDLARAAVHEATAQEAPLEPGTLSTQPSGARSSWTRSSAPRVH